MTITLIITGGIAAYKALELIRLLKKAGIRVRPVLTKGGAEFVTPLSVSSLAGEPARTELFDLTDDAHMDHIALARASDLVVVAPATADMLAKMAQGRADDLASALLLATDAPILAAPAMNPRMWAAAPTQANIKTLEARGVHRIGPDAGDAACGETGLGRMAEPEAILSAIKRLLARPGPLAGRKAVVTAGPTHEPIDPVRYIANHSSGKQGYALAAALAAAGADVALVSGPTGLAEPKGLRRVMVQTARAMRAAVMDALPADIAVCAAAVADWRAESAPRKIRKNGAPPALALIENPDILKELCDAGNRRPGFVMGFAAETGDLRANALEKLRRKGCDALIANDVSSDVFGADETQVLALWRDAAAPEGIRIDALPRMAKTDLARLLAKDIAAAWTR